MKSECVSKHRILFQDRKHSIDRPNWEYFGSCVANRTPGALWEDGMQLKIATNFSYIYQCKNLQYMLHSTIL